MKTRLLMVALLFALACGPKAGEIRMDPMEFLAERTDEGVVVEVMDPEILFDEGVHLFEEKRYPEAARKFTRILDRFGKTRFASAALFNRGLVLLADGRPADAAMDLERHLKDYPDDQGQADVWQKLGEAYSETGEWAKAEAALLRRMGMPPMTLLEEAEVRARLTRSLRMQGRFEDALREESALMLLHDRNKTLPEMDGNYFVAMASMEGGYIYHELFGRIKFILPVERMEKDLMDKATLFMKAQGEYLRTIRLRNSYWGVLAGVRVGRLYEDFFDDVMNAEVPPDLSSEDLAVYQTELKRQVRPLLAKAVDAYERNLSMSRMYGAKEEWFGDMEARLARLRKLLEEIPPPALAP